MTEEYTPELGQMMFGQPTQRFEVPRFVEPLLRGISDELCRVMFNKNQEEYNSPFDNTGASYRNEVFEVHAYSWADDEQPFNFKWGDLKISWYKYLGRGMSANQEISPDYAVRMFDACVASVRAQDIDWSSK